MRDLRCGMLSIINAHDTNFILIWCWVRFVNGDICKNGFTEFNAPVLRRYRDKEGVAITLDDVCLINAGLDQGRVAE